MKKYTSAAAFLFLFLHISTAQLTLQKIGSRTKTTIDTATFVDLKFPTKTSRANCDCFRSYSGNLLASNPEGILLDLRVEQNIFYGENGLPINERRLTGNYENPLKMTIPTTKMLSVTRHNPNVEAVQNFAAVVALLAVVSNLFLAPQLSAETSRDARNIGYIVMAVGVSTAFIPNRKTYYLEQPTKGKKKTLWKIVN